MTTKLKQMRFNLFKRSVLKIPNPTEGYDLVKQGVKAYLEGDKPQQNRIMGDFYKAYYDFIYQTALKKWHLPELEAEELFYVIFYALLNPAIVQKLNDCPSNFNLYVGGMIRNKALKIYGKLQKAPPLEVLTPEMHSIMEDLDAHELQIDKIKHLQNYLNLLKPDCKELILLKYLEGDDTKSLKQKALELEISEEAMRARKKRCTDAFKTHYKPFIND
jgi:RNA polymerase sigma factor (sigma-70 family)